jgi:selenocysteine lyase/cysteine desulfurase
VELAGYQAVAKKTMPWEILPNDFFEPVARLKQCFARLVNAADPEAVAVVPSVSYGIATAAKNVRMGRGQNLVTVEEVFPSNYYTWERLCAESGAELRSVQRPATADSSRWEGRGRLWNERLLEAIDHRTVAVALPHVHWADGTRFDLEAFRRRTDEVGALLVVDGTQSVGALPFDVQAIRPDALVCAGYKWLLGPYSIGLAFFGERLQGGVPIEENWINRLGSERFEGLTKYQPAYKPGANRYCMGEMSQFIGVPMLTAAIELILGWGVGNIQAYCEALTAPYLAALAESGFRIEESSLRSAHLVGVRSPPGASLAPLKNALLERQVYVSVRGDAIRVSSHVFNEHKDFERLMAAVRALL